MTDPRPEVAILKAAPQDGCVYCCRAFGALVMWNGRHIYLGEEWTRLVISALGGMLTVPTCSLCDRVIGTQQFDSLVTAQEYCLERLVAGGSMTSGTVLQVRHMRDRALPGVTPEEVGSLLAEMATAAPLSPQSQSQVEKRTRALESQVAMQERARQPMRRLTRRKSSLVPVTQCRLIRVGLGMSQQDLADLSGVPQPYISLIERGKPVHPQDLEKVAKVLNVEIEVLTQEVRG